MPILWEMLKFDTQVMLATAFKLPVYLVKTKWGVELRLRGIYYGDEAELKEIDQLMRQPAHYKMEKLAKG